MRVCQVCGWDQSDNTKLCTHCGEDLDKQFPELELEKLRESKGITLDKPQQESGELTPGLADIIAGSLSFVGLLATILCNLFLKNIVNGGYLLPIALLFIYVMAVTLIPGLAWEIEKLRLGFSFNNTQDLEPSDFYLTMKTIGPWLLLVIGGLLLWILIDMH